MTARPTCGHRWPGHCAAADTHRCALTPAHLRPRHVCACGTHSRLTGEETTDGPDA